jgi:hypothetical protein
MSNSNADHLHIENEMKEESNSHENIICSEDQNEIDPVSLLELSDDLISNLFGLSVEVVLKFENQNVEQKSILVKGKIFSILKTNNILILMRRDEKEQNSIISYMINIEQIQSIKLSEQIFEVFIFKEILGRIWRS